MYQQLNKRAKRGAVDTSHLSLRSLANQNPKTTGWQWWKQGPFGSRLPASFPSDRPDANVMTHGGRPHRLDP
jgi:hypothetical protein